MYVWIIVIQRGDLFNWMLPIVQGPRLFVPYFSHSSPKLWGKINNSKLPTVLRCDCCSIPKNPRIILESRQIIVPSTKKTGSWTKSIQKIFMKHEQVGAGIGYGIISRFFIWANHFWNPLQINSAKGILGNSFLLKIRPTKKSHNKEPFHLSISSPPKKGLGISPPPQNKTKNNQFDSSVFSASAKVQEQMSWLHVEVTWDEHKTKSSKQKNAPKTPGKWKKTTNREERVFNVMYFVRVPVACCVSVSVVWCSWPIIPFWTPLFFRIVGPRRGKLRLEKRGGQMSAIGGAFLFEGNFQ